MACRPMCRHHSAIARQPPESIQLFVDHALTTFCLVVQLTVYRVRSCHALTNFWFAVQHTGVNSCHALTSFWFENGLRNKSNSLPRKEPHRDSYTPAMKAHQCARRQFPQVNVIRQALQECTVTALSGMQALGRGEGAGGVVPMRRRPKQARLPAGAGALPHSRAALAAGGNAAARPAAAPPAAGTGSPPAIT